MFDKVYLSVIAVLLVAVIGLCISNGLYSSRVNNLKDKVSGLEKDVQMLTEEKTIALDKLKTCADSVFKAGQVAEELTREVKVAQAAAAKVRNVYIKSANEVLVKPAIGSTSCDRADSILKGLIP